jgi:hypothetical protein
MDRSLGQQPVNDDKQPIKTPPIEVQISKPLPRQPLNGIPTGTSSFLDQLNKGDATSSRANKPFKDKEG